MRADVSDKSERELKILAGKQMHKRTKAHLSGTQNEKKINATHKRNRVERTKKKSKNFGNVIKNWSFFLTQRDAMHQYFGAFKS